MGGPRGTLLRIRRRHGGKQRKRGDRGTDRGHGGAADSACGQRGALPQRHDAVGAAVDLSVDQGAAGARLRAYRDHHAGVPADRLDPAADDRALHRQAPAAVLAAVRDGRDLRRHAGAGGGRRLRHHAAGRGLDRHRQLGVPPRGVARGAARLRRALRLRPVGVPGRRQCRAGDQPAAGGAAGDPQRPALHRLVRARGRDRHRDPEPGRSLVPRPSGAAADRRCGGRRPCRRSGATG